MKKLLGVLALATAGTACQPQATTDTSLATATVALPVTNRLPAAHEALLADSLTTNVLAKYDLSPALQTIHTGQDAAPVQPLNGFFGTDNYRIEVVFTQVAHDPQQPGRYLMQGKDRFKKRITPFAGTVSFTKVERQANPGNYPAKDIPDSYTALGTYELHETGNIAGVGIFRGRIAADIGIQKNGDVSEYTLSGETAAKGGAILYDGTWTSATGQVKPATWVAEIFSYHGPQVFSDFTVGERDIDFNPKYAKLGWNSYWQNEEWWVESPKATASRATPKRMQENIGRLSLFTPPTVKQDKP